MDRSPISFPTVHRELGRLGHLHSRQDRQEPRWRSGEQKGRSLAKDLHPRNEAQKHGPSQRSFPGAWTDHTHTGCVREIPQREMKESGAYPALCGNLFPYDPSTIMETLMTGRERGWNLEVPIQLIQSPVLRPRT